MKTLLKCIVPMLRTFTTIFIKYLNIKSYIDINIGTYCTQNKITVFAILHFILTFYFHTNLIKMTQLNSN